MPARTAKIPSLGTAALLVLLVLLMVAGLEWAHPYFFFQDDNRSLYFPLLVHNLRALAGGEIPFFNFHQSLGTPTGIHYGTFYPLNYLALGLSKVLSGQLFMTMDILALLHLEIAALGFFYLMRHFRVTEWSAFFGAIAWTFCSFVITVGNSWGHIIGCAAWFPWILLLSLRQIRSIRIGELVTLTFLRIMPLVLGNPQFFVYIVTFDLLLLSGCYLTGKNCGDSFACQSREPGLKLGLAWGGSYLLVLLMSLPLVMQTIRLAGLSAGRKGVLPWEEYSALSYQVSHWLNGLIAPFHDLPVNTWVEQQFLSHIGYLPLFFISYALLRSKGSGRRKEILLLLVLALFSFLWAAGLGVSGIFYTLPVYNKFRFPFKLAFFTSFFLIMVATIGFDLFAARGKTRKWVLVLLLVLHAANFIGLYGLLPQRMFSAIQDKVPFDEPMKEVMADGRIVTGWLDPVFVQDKGIPGKTVPTVGYNYATLWGLYYFGGYDPLLPEKNFHASLGRINRGDFNVEKGKALDVAKEVPLANFRTWGVKWFVFEKSIQLLNTGGLVDVFVDDSRRILRDPRALPLVYWRDNPARGGIRYRFTTNAVQLETDSIEGGTVVVNVLYNPFFVAEHDHGELAVTETENGQMSLRVPPGRQTVLVRYLDRDFIRYAEISAWCLLVICAGGCYVLVRGYRRRQSNRQGV